MQRYSRPQGAPFQLDPAHDNRHDLSSVDNGRESLVFMLQLPEENVAAFVYAWVSSDNKAGTAICVYGEGVGQPTIFEAIDGIEVDSKMDFHDWRVQNVRVQHLAPHQRASVSYRGDKASIEYHFEAMHPAYNYGASPVGCPPWMAHDRLEQSGRAKGVLRIGEREISFDAFGHRDHSWGTRDWGCLQTSRWLEAQAGDDIAVHVLQYHSFGKEGVIGYVQKEGQIAEVEGIHYRHLALDKQLHQTALEAVIMDAAGRRTEVSGRVFALFEFPVSEQCVLNEGSMSVVIDGHGGVGHLEMGWQKSYLDYVREHTQVGE